MRVRRKNSRNCGIFFFAGAGTSLLLDLLGAKPLSTVSLLGSEIDILGILGFWTVPLVFSLVGIFIGIFTKEKAWALIYAACFGQLQMWLSIVVYYFIAHEGSSADIWLRALSGIVLCTALAGASFSVKVLLQKH